MSNRKILESLSSGEITVQEAEKLLSNNKIEVIDEFAKFDLLREKRTKIPEIVYTENKEPEQLKAIIERIMSKKPVLLLSRVTEKHLSVIEKFSDRFSISYGTGKRFCLIKEHTYEFEKKGGKVGIVTAGTSDIAVAEEAKIVAEMMGCDVVLINDIGVAGIHRLIEPLNTLLKENIDVIIVAAGMEGALPTVVAGLVDIPIIGLPISVGYGFGGKGETALRSMLQSCALGLAVVNIDAGVSAGAIAAKIALNKKNDRSEDEEE